MMSYQLYQLVYSFLGCSPGFSHHRDSSCALNRLWRIHFYIGTKVVSFYIDLDLEHKPKSYPARVSIHAYKVCFMYLLTYSLTFHSHDKTYIILEFQLACGPLAVVGKLRGN